MRAHGTRACYVFGPEPGNDNRKGCRCVACKAANAAYTRRRVRAQRRPDEELLPAYISASQVRRHLVFLASRGVGSTTVASLTGLSGWHVRKLATGRTRRCRPSTAAAILALIASDATPLGRKRALARTGR